MKKLLSILSICLVFVSCSPDKVLIDVLIDKGDEFFYYEDKPFTGVAFDVYPNGQLHSEFNFKNGKADGLAKYWYENGQLAELYTFKNGVRDGLFQIWTEDGIMLRDGYSNDEDEY
jgi:antitoxin component YwqK of YwqJK toxin-antitoxin module